MLVEIGTQRTFTLDEANELLPLVITIFDKHEKKIKYALEQQRFFIKTGAPQGAVTECDDIVRDELVALGRKLLRLSIRVLGDSYIGFDSGEWLWSYKYPEQKIEFFHGYFENPRYTRHKIAIMRLLDAPQGT